MLKRLTMLSAGLFLMTGVALAQSTVSGTVVDDNGEPIVGAAVRVAGTKTGTVTDVDGHFSIAAPANSKLTVSYLGMKDQTVNAGQNIKVTLSDDQHSLEEVIVTGYGNFKKSSFTGAASTMSTSKLDDVPSMSVEDKLQGNIAGVSVSNMSGQPGAMNFIRIRGMGSINAGNTSAESYKYDSKMTSILGRVNYNYDNKYYLGASYRRDGSSRMARDNRWGSFWSVSGAWRFGVEKFMDPLKSVLTDGKLRVSYGVNGTLPSGYYSYMNLYKYGQYYNGSNGMGIVGIGNKDLKWEQNKAWNFGLDLTFIDRINVTLDYYVRNTSNLIMDRPVSYVPGYYDGDTYAATVAQNVGSLRNTGIEFSIQSTNIQTKDLTWTTSLNFGHNKNKITKLTGDDDQIISGIFNHKVGYAYYSYYMYEYAGVDPQTGLESYYINDGTENARNTCRWWLYLRDAGFENIHFWCGT